MRHLILALLTLCPSLPLAFEIEAETTFAAEDESRILRIISTTDTGVFTPIIEGFQAENPDTTIIYTAVSSSQINQAIVEEGAVFDVAISSAMDLQTKLANDGHTLQYASDATALIPDWGTWRDSVFAFTQEPAALVLSPAALGDLPIPTSRQELIGLLRDHPDVFAGRIATYDVRSSGLGYLFATQDSRTSESFWRLTELMGSLDVQLYCCSSDMIEDVSRGEIAIAYNVLGSYAEARTDLADSIVIVEPEDYTTVMLRSAVILRDTLDRDAAEAFVDHLLTQAWQPGRSDFPFPNPLEDAPNARPIPLGPGRLVFLDQLKRDQFLSEWQNAILQ